MIPLMITALSVAQCAFSVPMPAHRSDTLMLTAQKPPVSKSKPPADEKEGKSLFDGKTLDGWQRTAFSGGGDVTIEPKFKGNQAAIIVNTGEALSGFNWTGDELPKTNYEITLEAMKLEGHDFFCGLTFPVGDSHASLILGGWGGGTVGISSIDSQDASMNETSKNLSFAKNRWFKVRMRVTPTKLEAWLDGKQIVSVNIEGKKISMRRGEIENSIPLGLSTYQTRAAFRAIRLKRLDKVK